jgi:TFIIF-interacting CTD phosphatase-like protein
MAKYYEIISFSEFMPADCNRIINAIDETGFVRHRLYKYHLDGKRGSKEVSRIGRDTQKVVLLDTVALQETTEDGGNLLQVGAWRGESADAQLA